MTRFKAAIIGGGHIATQNHIPALKALDERVEMIAICSRDLTKAKALAAAHGIPHAYDNAGEMFNLEEKPNLIINCTANHLHHAYTLQALHNHCHVLCEKPPALKAAEAREMADLAKEKGLTLAYNFQRRQTPEFALLKKYKEEGKFGKIYHLNVQYLRRRGIPGWGNFTNKSIQGGGALIDLGVHLLDLALVLLDYAIPDQIIANMYDHIGKLGGKGLKGSWDPSRFEVEDACFAHLSFGTEASLTLSCSFALNQKEAEFVNLEVFGSQAGASMNPLSISTEINGELADIQFNHLTPTNIQLENTKAFLDACDGLPANLCSAEEGAILQHIVEQMYQSAQR